MKTDVSRWVAIAAVWSLGACADWFASDTCGLPSLHLEMTPSPACLQLSASVDTRPGYYQIVGTNTCAEPLVVQSIFTEDGGPSTTFPAGAHVLISLNESEVFNQGPMKTWERNAGLGTQIIMITLTKAPC